MTLKKFLNKLLIYPGDLLKVLLTDLIVEPYLYKTNIIIKELNYG